LRKVLGSEGTSVGACVYAAELYGPFVAGADGHDHPLRFFIRGSKYRWFFGPSSAIHLFGVDRPGRIFLAGTDEFGRDQLSRILWGGQISLATGWLAALLALSLGLGWGLIAGYTLIATIFLMQSAPTNWRKAVMARIFMRRWLVHLRDNPGLTKFLELQA